MIEILAAGSVTSVQDMGRTGYRAMGVGEAGAMDRLSLQVANLLVGNAPGAAAIENAAAALCVGFTTTCAFAVSGAPARVRLDRLAIPSFWSMVAEAGQLLEIAPSPVGMWTYLALAGGVDVAPVLGSRSTDMKSRFGGHEGRPLAAGDRLKLCGKPAVTAVVGRAGGFGVEPPGTGAIDGTGTAVRALPAREYAFFGPAAQARFWDADWVVQADSNRIGYRLAGPTLEPLAPLDLLSYGLVPGVVQVPPAGQPVIQLSEANTCGGYPKMAVVASADLRLVAQTQPGRTIRFIQCTREDALRAARDEQTYLARVARHARGSQALGSVA